ncbi:MAG: GntR family transcriptional regulator [Clostridiales bacterium]|nr:GntR family transcriptional regulator [Clostridiales bacterium]
MNRKKIDKNVKETLADFTYKKLKNDIICQVLKPGERINTKQLAKRYGTSEMPIKLALNRLESEHILERFPRQGIRVKPIDLKEAVEICDIRLMMDLYYVKDIIIAVSHSEFLKQELHNNVNEHLELMRQTYSTNNDKLNEDILLKNHEYDFKFHELYLTSSGNKKIIDVYHKLNPFMYCNYIFNKQSEEKSISGVLEHKMILDAIIEGDEEKVREMLINHHDNTKRTIELILKVENML